LLAELRADVARKAELARALEDRAAAAPAVEARDLRDEASALRRAVSASAGGAAELAVEDVAARELAASADRERLLAAQRATPDDPAVLVALLAHLGDREPGLRREALDRAAADASGRAQAIALHELALLARGDDHEPIRAAALWTKAHRVDPSYAPVWMPLADALASADEIAPARELYEQIARSSEYDAPRRIWAAERADTLGRDDSIVSGEIGDRAARPIEAALLPRPADLVQARQLADANDLRGAIAAAERAAASAADDARALEMLEELYLTAGDVSAASEAIGRQLMIAADPLQRASLWRRRARLYRELAREAEAYRCLKEAHACSPADADIAHELRMAAIVRSEWALVASLLYREIAGAPTPRERGALHCELAMVFDERLADPPQAQVNFEQALAFDPMIPAAKAPLARRYESSGRFRDAARMYEDAAASARPQDRAALLAGAERCRAALAVSEADGELVAQLEHAALAGDTDAAADLARQLWLRQPGHPNAYRVLATTLRAAGDLPALTELATTRSAHATDSDARATAWLELAHAAEELGALTEAARAYDLALIEDPGHVGALDARGALAFRLGDWATADLIYRDLAPAESALGGDELALRRSIIAEQLGRDGEALVLAEEAARAAPGRRDALMRVQELATRVGELEIALTAARAVLDLVPLDDDRALLATRFALIELYRALGLLDAAARQLEQIIRDHPHHASALEQLAEIFIAKDDWRAATRYLYQLVPLAPTPAERAERLYRLGEAVLVHLGDVDRADDVFLRASDLDPSHVPTLRRLLDVYWRADDPAALVEVASELATSGGLDGPVAASSLAQALVAAALVGDTQLAARLVGALGDEAPARIARALGELIERRGRFELASASTAIAELGRRGLIDVHKIRAAATGTAVEPLLG
jgi:lipopolysaccharide biosynthesis regulator YciM